MNAFEEAWKETGRAEGGFVDDPDDSGGATNWGVTERVARKFGYTGDMRDLPQSTATQIAKKEYWDVMKLDDIAALSEPIALELFDTGFNAGTGRAGKFIQRALNVMNRKGQDYDDIVVDGAVGGKTVTALTAFLNKRGKDGETVMLRALNALQGEFYVELAERREKDETFVFGWFLHRVKM
jgi:lysozyme family protein